MLSDMNKTGSDHMMFGGLNDGGEGHLKVKRILLVQREKESVSSLRNPGEVAALRQRSPSIETLAGSLLHLKTVMHEESDDSLRRSYRRGCSGHCTCSVAVDIYLVVASILVEAAAMC